LADEVAAILDTHLLDAMWITPPVMTHSLRAKVDDAGVSAPAAGTGEVEQQPAESEIGGCRLRCG
jgi:hypothetical protein